MPRADKDNDIDEIDFQKPLTAAHKEIMSTHLALDHEAAIRNGSTGYLVRGIVNAAMPYKNPNVRIFERRNGDTTLTMIAGSSFGLPFGRYPRLLMAWLTTEIVRTRSPELYLGGTLRDFLVDVAGVRDSGGARGTRTLFIDQIARLFTTSITLERVAARDANGKPLTRGFRFQNISVGDELELDDANEKLLWTPWKDGEQKFQSRLVVSSKLLRECLDSPVPLNLAAYKYLSDSPMRMDIYTWLCYRNSYLTGRTRPIPWLSLMQQFGSAYTGQDAGSNFKRDFLKQLDFVSAVYPEAKVQVKTNGLVLIPSPTHVAKLSYRKARGDQGELDWK